jgi:homoserine O-acetyltransferase
LEENSAANSSDAWFDNYRFSDGKAMDRVRIHYATLGTPHRNAQGDIDNAVLVLHWTGADGRALLTPTYMKALFDPHRPLDARRYYLIFADSIGHGRSSKPSDGLRASFPNYGYRDMVDLQHRLVTQTLGIKHLHAILGMSMGGMNAWQWAEAYPDAMDGIMPVVFCRSRCPVATCFGDVWSSMTCALIPNGGEGTTPDPRKDGPAATPCCA